MTLTSGGLVLVTNASCLAPGCPLVLTNPSAATDPHQRWVWDHQRRLRPVADMRFNVLMGAPGTAPTLANLSNTNDNLRWNHTGEGRRVMQGLTAAHTLRQQVHGCPVHSAEAWRQHY